MSNSRVIRKLPTVALVFVLCLGVLLPGAVHFAWAADHTITYRGIGDDVTETVQSGEYTLKAPHELATPKNVPDGKGLKGIQVGDNTEELKQPGDKISVGGNIILTYILGDKYTITIKGDGEEEKKETVVLLKGEKYTLKKPSVKIPDGKEFKGIQVGENTELKQPGDEIEVKGDITLTYQFKDKAKTGGAEKKGKGLSELPPPPSPGSCGSCTWEYTLNEDKKSYALVIKPGDKQDAGVLSPWKGTTPPWAAEEYKIQVSNTTSVTVEGFVGFEETKGGSGTATAKAPKGTTAGMFKGFERVIVIKLSGLDTAGVEDMREMFSGCKALTDLKVDDLDTSSVTKMSGMFKDCSALKKLVLSGGGWDTSNVVSFADIFSGCVALKELDISTWSTGEAGPDGTSKMFEGVSHLRKMIVSHKVNLKKAGIETLFGKYVTWSPESDSTRTFKTAAALKRFHHSKKNFDGAETYLRTKKRGTWKKDADGQVCCMQDGEPLTGWQNLWGTVKNPSSKVDHWFYFDEEGYALTGKHKLFGGKKNDKGETEEHWFYFDEETGAQVRGWVEGDGNKKGTWCYYSLEDGAGLADGRYEVEGGKDGAKHWFAFDKEGQQIRGWHSIDNQWYFYAHEDGVGCVGQLQTEGGKNGGMNWFYFDEATGAQIRGWKEIKDQNKWCYYSDEDGIMLKGQHELPGGDNGGKNWFYFDEETGAQLRNTWKDIPSQGKKCYYGSDGAMFKGTHVIDGKEHHFDPVTGALV